jgi:hypothetical protein
MGINRAANVMSTCTLYVSLLADADDIDGDDA